MTSCPKDVLTLGDAFGFVEDECRSFGTSLLFVGEGLLEPAGGVLRRGRDGNLLHDKIKMNMGSITSRAARPTPQTSVSLKINIPFHQKNGGKCREAHAAWICVPSLSRVGDTTGGLRCRISTK